MKIEIDLQAGNSVFNTVTKEFIQKNIDAQRRAVDGKLRGGDMALLMDTLSILEGIQSKLPNA